MPFFQCTHGRAPATCMVCATQSLERTVRESAEATAAATTAAARQAREDAEAQRRYAQSARQQAEALEERAARNAARDADRAAGQVDDLRPGTLSRPDAADMVEMAARRYRHLPGWPFVQTYLTRFAEAASPGEQAVGVSGGLVLNDAHAAEGVVLVTTHGLLWSMAAAQPVWMPFSLVDSFDFVRLVGTIEGYAFKVAIGELSLTLMPADDDRVGSLAMSRGEDAFTASTITPINDKHTELLEMARLAAPGALGRFAVQIGRYVELTDGRELRMEHTEVEKRKLGLWALTDTHMIDTHGDGVLRATALADVSPKKLTDTTGGTFDRVKGIGFEYRNPPHPTLTTGSWRLPEAADRLAWKAELTRAVKAAAPAPARRGWFSR